MPLDDLDAGNFFLVICKFGNFKFSPKLALEITTAIVLLRCKIIKQGRPNGVLR